MKKLILLLMVVALSGFSAYLKSTDGNHLSFPDGGGYELPGDDELPGDQVQRITCRVDDDGTRYVSIAGKPGINRNQHFMDSCSESTENIICLTNKDMDALWAACPDK